ncbi:metallophosphoesterase [Lentibacillus sp. CBA3610]|uniref:metallophosphoesterase n=1 Tax=Lentibacillus sp. CBA3610 TaxID=2518176 RepID=UPI00159599AC|nr:metallophosphoesterase [Lentibacillus sp. CBA3610]QKY68899.1 metallophosphoesterase [Lentibacillus sp. CBA3610]
MNRRTFLKRSIGSLLALIGLGGGTYYYAREIEPNMLDIKHEQLTSDKIPKAFNDFKILQFSDTHIGHHYSLEQLSDLIDTINEQNPDLILFTGDLVDEPHTYHWDNNLIQILQKLQSDYGKYWIYGNHDHGGYGTDIVQNVMEKAGFNLLQNEHVEIEIDNQQIVLAGIDDVMLGRPDLESTLTNADPDLYTLLLAHEPDYADNTVHFPVDVQLSGHSHGGQVRLPFIGHLYTPLYAQNYVQGKHEFQNGKLTLYVNQGIGTTRLPYRFLCQPEIHVYTLNRDAE